MNEQEEKIYRITLINSQGKEELSFFVGTINDVLAHLQSPLETLKGLPEGCKIEISVKTFEEEDEEGDGDDLLAEMNSNYYRDVMPRQERLY